MNHLPFETWLLSDEPLSEDDSQALREHLQGCEQCNQLKDAWTSVEVLFADIPEMEPTPGFVNRWQTRLESSRQIEQFIRHRWQSWIMLIGIANAAAFTLVLLGAQFLNTYDSMMEYLLTWVYRGAVTLTLFNGIQEIIFTLFRTIPGAIPLAGWIVLLVILGGAVLIWLYSMFKFASMPRRAS